MVDHALATADQPRQIGRRQFRTNQRRRSAIDILQKLKNVDAWVGSIVQATIVGAWSNPQCIATRQLLSADGFTLGLCPISGPRQKLAAACSIE